MFVVTGVAPAAPNGLTGSPRAEFVPRELLVQFRPGVGKGVAARRHAQRGVQVVKRFPALGVDLIRLPRGLDVRSALARYLADPLVAVAEPNFVRHPTQQTPDEFFADLWGIDNTGQPHAISESINTAAGEAGADIAATDAWTTQTGSAVVAVIDTGVDVTHPDLAANIWTNPNEVPADGLDNDGNGYADDVNGWNFADGNNDLRDLIGHGTHVAGTIAAQRDNGAGIAGVCPGCKVMVLKIADSSGSMSIADEVAALNYARTNGAKVVNMSLGGPTWSAAERNALKAGASSFLAVVSAGNESLDNDMWDERDCNGDGVIDGADCFSPTFPASYNLPNILSVAATNHVDDYGYQTGCVMSGFSRGDCAFSSWGHDSVDVAAPGVDVKSTVPDSLYETWDGTSMAAPHVAGVAGLVVSGRTLTPAQVKNVVMNKVDKPTSLTRLYSQISAFSKTGSFSRTNGRVNAAAAVDPTASTANATPLTDGNVDGAKAWTTASIRRSVAWPADVNDVYRRKLYRGRTYQLTLDGPLGKNFDLWVWKPGTLEVWQVADACYSGGSSCKIMRVSASGDADEVVRFKASITGVYYVHVTAYRFQSGTYTLKFKPL
jgi:subtilisin family serine protease